MRVRNGGAILAGFYVAAVSAVAVSRAVGGVPPIGDVALTPDRLAEGRVYLLLTSAFVVQGPVVPQLLLVGGLAAAVVRVRGSRAFWGAALLGHVGATLLVYGGVALLYLEDAGWVERLLDEPDYGISCVWAGALGVAAALCWRARGGRAAAVAVVALVAVLSAFSDGLALPEHVVAFCLGALLGLRRSRGRGSWPSTQSAASAVRGRSSALS